MTHATYIGRTDEHLRAHRATGPIVAAVGPSGGEAVLRMTHALAARHSTAAIIASVVSPPSVVAVDYSQPMLDTWPVQERRAERQKLIHDRLHTLGPWLPWREEPDVTIAYGDTSTSIADIAHERGASLIVVGAGPAHRHNPFDAETALATVRRAHSPVLVVAHEATTLPKVVIVATDFSPSSVHAAVAATQFIADGAIVHLLHVWSHIRTPQTIAALREIDETYVRSLPERFERVRSAIGRAHRFVFSTIVREGSPAQTVLDVAHEQSADLIVAGRRGFGPIERLLLGSVSTSLVRGAPCSILIVPDADPVTAMRLERHMTGASSVSHSRDWAHELEDFARRNRLRRTALEIDDSSIGAQVQESGYLLTGATFDPHDRCVQLMFEHPDRANDHLTRSIGGVRSIATTCNAVDVDSALCIDTDHGSALLTFPAGKPQKA